MAQAATGAAIMANLYNSYHGIRARSAVDALFRAAANSQFREMKLLIADGVDINGISTDQIDTALHKAAGAGLIRSVNLLIAAGADLDAKSKWSGFTPLMSACNRGKIKGSRVALRLIEAGADVRHVTRWNCGEIQIVTTALCCAAVKCTLEVIRALIAGGAEVDGPEDAPITPLMSAARENNVAALEVLVAHGADLSRPCKLDWAKARTAEGLAELERCRASMAFFRSL